MNIKTFSLILVHEICGTVEQILFKKGASHPQTLSLRGIKGHILFIKNILMTPTIWLGFGMTIASWIVWFVVLAGIELSVAIPVDSIHYIMILAASYFFLGERMHWTRIVGTLFILLGITLVAFS